MSAKMGQPAPVQRTLSELYRFYKERHAAPLAYYFARRAHVDGSMKISDWIGGVK